MQPAPRPPKVTFISFARGFSILAIVVYHLLLNVPLPPLLARANQLGGAGIYVFLFASSYGLYFSRVSGWGSFYRKRFRKVLIPYYIAVTLIFVVNLFVAIYPQGWQAYLSHLLLYKMFYEPYVESFGPQLWFISTIVQFYLLWPLLLALARRLSTASFLLLMFATSLLYSGFIFRIGVQEQRIWSSSVVQYLWLFGLGLVAARAGWFPRLLTLGWGRYGLLAAAGLGGTVLLGKLLGPAGNVFNDYFMFVAFSAISILLFLLGERLGWVSRFMLWIESFSYSFYLTHLLVFSLYLKATRQLLIASYEVPLVLGLCIVAALGFERAVVWLTRWPAAARSSACF